MPAPGRLQTPNCIRATAFDAISLDYNSVVVLSDATASATTAIQVEAPPQLDARSVQLFPAGQRLDMCMSFQAATQVDASPPRALPARQRLIVSFELLRDPIAGG